MNPRAEVLPTEWGKGMKVIRIDKIIPLLRPVSEEKLESFV